MLTNAFYEAVRSGDVLRVRIMMHDSLLVDPTFAEFNSMEKAASSMTGLYDEHDGKEFVEDRNLWNDDYMNKVMVKVLYNFSHERIDHLKEVVRYLHPPSNNMIIRNNIVNRIKKELNIDISNLSISIDKNDDKYIIKNKIIKEIKKII